MLWNTLWKKIGKQPLKVTQHAHVKVIVDNETYSITNVNYVDGKINALVAVKEKDSEETVVTKCYGREETWGNREEAINFYRNCMKNSEGSEYARYSRVYAQLVDGEKYCTDETD